MGAVERPRKPVRRGNGGRQAHERHPENELPTRSIVTLPLTRGPWSRPVRQRRQACVGRREPTRAWLLHAWSSSQLVSSLVAAFVAKRSSARPASSRRMRSREPAVRSPSIADSRARTAASHRAPYPCTRANRWRRAHATVALSSGRIRLPRRRSRWPSRAIRMSPKHKHVAHRSDDESSRGGTARRSAWVSP